MSIRESTDLKSEAKPVTVTTSFGMEVYPEDSGAKKEVLISAG
jgi:hypothetical protein